MSLLGIPSGYLNGWGALNIRTTLADLRSNTEEAGTRDQIRDISRELFVGCGACAFYCTEQVYCGKIRVGLPDKHSCIMRAKLYAWISLGQ